MISKTAITNFFNRPLPDIRKQTESNISQKLATLKPKPVFITEPFEHQKVCFYAMAQYGSLVLLLDMGLGKSKLILDFVRYKQTTAVILVPNIVTIESWREQRKQHAPDISFIGFDRLKTVREKNDRAFNPRSQLLVLTYAGLNSLLSDRIRGQGLMPNPDKITEFVKCWNMIVCDESTMIMNRRALTTQICMQLSRQMPYRFCLTGTPFGRDPEALWSQFYIVDHGKALGSNITMYRSVFFDHYIDYWKGHCYTFKKKLTPDLRRMMRSSSVHYESDECLDLPERVYVKIPVVFTQPVQEIYSKILLELRKIKDNPQLLQNVFIRMRQIASGFMSVKTDTGEKECISLGVSPKEEALIEWIKEIDSKEKIVVFHDFIWSGQKLLDRLAKEKILATRIFSGTKDKSGELNRFLSDPNCRIMLLNSQSGALGLNLQIARYVAFYECPVSAIVRQQAEKRCHRPGQTQKVFIYDFFVQHSVEEKILAYVKEGKDLLAMLLAGKINIENLLTD